MDWRKAFHRFPPQLCCCEVGCAGTEHCKEHRVCPALFDLGEDAKVAILSVTEGDDKPLKYPHMFRAARLVLLNKVDLLPHLDFDLAKAISYARDVNLDVTVLQVSAKTGEGMVQWYHWIARRLGLASGAAAKILERCSI